MTEYEQDAAEALTDIEEAGRPITIIKKARAHDPITDTISDGATISKNTFGLLTEYSTKDIDEKTVKTGDKRFLIGDPGFKPDNSFSIIDGTETYSVVAVKAVSPGPTVILYKVQVRK